MKITVALIVKGNESNLLALSEGREKSFIPVLGGGRIIDYYLQPLIRAGVNRINVICEQDMVGLKDYILYSYTNKDVKVMGEEDGWKNILSLLKLRRGEGTLLIRADNLLFADWAGILLELDRISEGDYTLFIEKNPIGFFILEPHRYNRLKNSTQFSFKRENLDGIWKDLLDLFVPDFKPFYLSGTFIRISTPYEYHWMHLLCLEQRDKLFYFDLFSFFPGVEEGLVSEITRSGYVKDSYIAPSCIIEGKVERSVIFPHVRIGKSARVKNSIIMENNYIGNGAEITNTILCDHIELFPRMIPNVGEGAVIGELEEGGCNSQFPDLIYGGLTLIGQNVEIPKGVQISANCYVASGIERSLFRSKKSMKPGECMLNG